MLARVTREFQLCCSNSLGGTESMPNGLYRIQVTEVWYDYETGDRAKGLLLDEKDVEMVRKKFFIEGTPAVKLEFWNPASVYGLGTGGPAIEKPV